MEKEGSSEMTPPQRFLFRFLIGIIILLEILAPHRLVLAIRVNGREIHGFRQPFISFSVAIRNYVKQLTFKLPHYANPMLLTKEE